MTNRETGAAGAKDDASADPVETGRYIGGITRELKVLAANSGMGFLSYLLSMAEEEAFTIARGAPPRRRDVTRKAG